MMRYAPLAVERLGAAVCVLPAYAAKPTRRERVSRRGPSGAGERAARALTQERAQRTLRRLPAGRTAAARGRPGERPPSCVHPRGLPGHGKPSTAPEPRHTARSVKDQSNNTPLRPGRGLGVPNPQGMRQPTPALPGTSVPVLHAQCLRPTSTDGQDRTPYGDAVTEQQTTRMLASPGVGASSAGGSLPGARQCAHCNPGSCPGASRGHPRWRWKPPCDGRRGSSQHASPKAPSTVLGQGEAETGAGRKHEHVGVP